jgi:hypothetical protein
MPDGVADAYGGRVILTAQSMSVEALVGLHCGDPNCYQHQHGADGVAAKIRQDIRRVGWSVIGILGNPSFAYTVGMTDKRLPELYFALDVLGTPQALKKASDLLNAVGHHIVTRDRQVNHGSTIELVDADGETWKVLLERRLHTRPLAKASQMYGSRLRVLEVDLVD